MHWQHTPYTLPLVLSAVASTALALFAWRRYYTPLAKPFALLMLAAAGWSLAYALRLNSADLSAQVFWTQVSYVFMVTSPVALLVLAIQYTGRTKWLTRRNLILVSIMPLLTLLVIWTNEMHNLFWSDVKLDTSGAYAMLDVTHGAWFWVYAAYSNLLLVIATALFIQALLHSRPPYRQRAALFVIGLMIPWGANAIFMFGLSPFHQLDLTPFAFTITGLVAAWGIFGFQIFDIVPVARDAVIESMSDGVIVLDAQSRIVDLNPAAEHIIGRASLEVIGQSAAQVLSGEADLVERYHDVMEVRTEITIGEDDTHRAFDLRISPLCDRRGHVAGRVIVLHDISQRKQVEEELRYLSTHDTLTGLHNRAYFEDELARLRREGQFPVSVIVADVDGLKVTNDRLGHQAGDSLLRQTAGVLRAAFHAKDVVARIGGDEFAVLLPHTDARAAAQALTRIRNGLQAHNAALNGPPIVLSLGTATAERPGLLSWALREADDSMYREKADQAPGP